MSIRDNDVTVSAENNTDNNTNGKVHQAPLAHAEKKSELPALLNKLKRAFSTEDTYTEKDSPQSDVNDLTKDNNTTLKDIFSRFKRTQNTADKEQAESTKEKDTAEKQQTADSTQKKAPAEKEQSAKTPEKEPEAQQVTAEKKEPDVKETSSKPEEPAENDASESKSISEEQQDISDEDELELAMINAILDGKDISDMEFPKPEVQKTEEPTESNKADESRTEEAKQEETESISEPELDIQNAFEDEEADFVMADFEADGEETEDISDIILDIDNSEAADLEEELSPEQTAEDISADDTEVKAVTADTTDGTPKAEETKASADDTEVKAVTADITYGTPKTEETKASADDTEVKAVTADITDGTPKTEETKASADDTEVKAVTADTADGTPKAEETKASADDTEVKAVTADTADGTPKTEETKASADDTEVKAVTADTADGTPKAEETKASADDTEVKAVTADTADGTPKTEETKASADDTEVKADNTQAGEYILTETSIVIIEDANDEDDEFDEDVQIDDEQPFDESLDDIDLDQLADLDTTIEELTPVIDSDNNEASQMPPAVKPVIDITPENNSEKTENTPAAAEEPKAEPADAKEENKPAAAAADTPVQNETKAPEKKSFFSKTKDKLTELWNTKSVPIHLNHTDAPLQPEKAAEAQAQAHTEQHSEPQSDAAKPTEENKDLVPSASAQQSEQAEKKTDINIVPIENHTVFADSEPTPILRDDDDDEDEEQEEVLSEDLYKDLFDGGSEYEKFAKKIYGSNYKKKVDEESAKPARPKMTVITNDNIIDSTDIDSDKVRGTLNVIKRDPKEAILTEKQRKQEENNRIVLEKCEIFNQETAQRQAEARKERSERTAREYEKRFEQIKHVTELDDDNYIAPGSIDTIKVKSGNFSESVKFEYDFYIGYLKLKEGVRKTIKKDAPEPQEQTATAAEAPAAPQEKRPPKPETPKRQYSKSRDKLSGIIDALDEKDSKHPDAFEYRNENEASDVRRRLRLELTSYKSRFTISMLLTIAALILCMFSNKFSVGAGENAAGISVRIFAVINCVLYFAEIYNVRSIIKHGFKRITKLDTNRDTIIAAASAAAALQALLAVFTPSTFLKGGLNLYTIIIMFTLTINTYGRYKNAHRKSLNFRFVSDPDQKYTAKFFSDRRMLATLLSGTRNERSELVFQKKTSFLKHFIKLSKEHDPGEDIAKRISLPSLIITLIVTILYAALSKSFCDTISFLTIMLCSCVPICSQTLGALPLFKLSKTALENDSMVVGYPAIKEFADSAALMIDAKELYPEGAVHMETIKTFDNHRKDEAVLAAAAVMIAAGGAMAGMYDELIKNNTKVLPSADNVMYLDGKGLIGWVNNERYFIGTRELLISQRIEPMPLAYEQEQKKGGGEILYIARSGELVAMYIVTYSANGRVADVLSRMESTGVNLLIRTTDPNITADRIAKDFGISYQNIKILEQKNSNVIRDEMIGKERSYPAFIATKGGVTSFGKALTECIQTKGNISMSVVIQLVAVILEVLVIILFGLFAGVAHIHAVPCFIYGIFWTVAILAGPAIMQRLQHNSRL